MEQRYKELRDAGIIETEHILGYLRDWVSRIGTANYEREYEKWPNSPCIKNYTDSIYRVKKWLEVEIANMDRVYHYSPEAERLKSIEDRLTLIEEEIDHEDTATDAGIDEALEDALNGGAEVETEPEFDAMLNEIWGVNP